MTVTSALRAMATFQGASLTASLAEIERGIIGLNASKLAAYCGERGIDHSFIASAVSIKQLAGQINVIIHSAGILCALPQLLDRGEVIESVSLGAGNTGRKFDLETNKRVAEFKFIDWRGGAESIRQTGFFKDFYELAEYKGSKHRFLYVVDTNFPLRFLNSGRALSSVLSRMPSVLESIRTKYGADVVKVSDYYRLKQEKVAICDISPFIGRDL